MGKRIALMVFLVVLLLWMGTSCDSNNGIASGVRVKMVAKTNQSGIANTNNGRLAGEDSIVFTDALIGVTELEFEANEHDGENDDGEYDDNGDRSVNDDGENDNDDENENDHEGSKLKFEGEFVVDLISGTSTPDFGVATVVPGVYSEIKVELAPVLSDSNSIFIKATYVTAQGAEYNLEFSTKLKIDFKVESDEGIEVTDALNSILVVVNMDDLFEGIDFSQATVDNDNVIRINATSNPEIAEQIASNFNTSVKCGEDEDGDNDIDHEGEDDGD